MRDSIKKAMCIIALLVLCLSASSQAATSICYLNTQPDKDVDYLAAYGYDVTYMNNPVGLVPGQLSGFEAVLVTDSVMFTEPAVVGNALAAYADAGGGVVITEFCFQGMWALQGQIMTPGYSPFTADPSSSGYGIIQTGLVVHDPTHPIFDGVNTANVPTYWQANVGLDAGATSLAEWPSGRDAVAFNTLAGGNSVVGLNMFPADFYANSMMTPDSQRLVANALGFSIGSGDDEGLPTAPVPGAAVLGFLGVGLTGWLRRRCSL